jgi:uncharacterized peroxidase-related enzyme
MAHLDYVDPEAASRAVQSILETDEETYGRPSLFARVMAHHPGLLEARQQYTEAVVEKGELDPTLVELIAVAISGTNDCAYCVVSHVEHLIEQLGVEEDLARAVARRDYQALDSRERAVVELADQIARDPAGVGPDGIDRLRTVGFEDDEIVAIVTACAMAVSANVIADALGLDPADRTAPIVGLDRSD